MAIIRSGEIRDMEASELDEKEGQLRKDLMKMKGVLASGGIPEGVGKTREIKRTIARILTVKSEKEGRDKAVKAAKTVKGEVSAKK